jgi:hypothetical protein
MFVCHEQAYSIQVKVVYVLNVPAGYAHEDGASFGQLYLIGLIIFILRIQVKAGDYQGSVSFSERIPHI